MAPLLIAAWEPAEPQDPLFQTDLIMYLHLTIYPLTFKEAPATHFQEWLCQTVLVSISLLDLLDTQAEHVSVVCEF